MMSDNYLAVQLLFETCGFLLMIRGLTLIIKKDEIVRTHGVLFLSLSLALFYNAIKLW